MFFHKQIPCVPLRFPERRGWRGGGLLISSLYIHRGSLPCAFLFVTPCVPRDFPLTFLVHILTEGSPMSFSSDTPSKLCIQRAIHLGTPCVPWVFPCVFGSCFLIFSNEFLNGPQRVSAISISALPSVSTLPSCTLLYKFPDHLKVAENSFQHTQRLTF